jgi:hypothetical protein
VIYDRTAGEIRVFMRSKGQNIQKTIVIENSLEIANQQAKAFIQENTRH